MYRCGISRSQFQAYRSFSHPGRMSWSTRPTPEPVQGPNVASAEEIIGFMNFTTVSFSLVFLCRILSYAFSGIGHGFTFQISVAYSAIVRSLENFPEPATFKMALRAHPSGSAYNAFICASAARYELR